MAGERHELIEVYEFRNPVLVEDANRRGRLIVRGEFGRAGVPTANRRIYTRRLWEREFSRLAQLIAERKITGELNHPKDGRADMFNTSHILTGLTLTPEGIVIGEAEVLEDLPGGKVVASIYRRGGKVGVSSRGFGSTQIDESGNEVVQEDYQLVTFDFVSDPADQYAYPEAVNEGSRPSSGLSLGENTAMPTEIETLRQEMTQRLLTAVAEAREDAGRNLMERWTADPSKIPPTLLKSVTAYLGQKGALAESVESPALVEARAERDAAIQKARQASYLLYVERTVAASPDADFLREGVGDVMQYESATALKAKLASLQEEATARRVEEAQQAEYENARRVALDAERNSLEETIRRQDTALQEALQTIKELTATVYQAEVTQRVPMAPAARRTMQTVPMSSDSIDLFLESQRPPVQDDESLARARANARARMGSPTRTNTALSEERSTRQLREGNDNFEGLGVSLNELRSLSGIGTN